MKTITPIKFTVELNDTNTGHGCALIYCIAKILHKYKTFNCCIEQVHSTCFCANRWKTLESLEFKAAGVIAEKRPSSGLVKKRL